MTKSANGLNDIVVGAEKVKGGGEGGHRPVGVRHHVLVVNIDGKGGAAVVVQLGWACSRWCFQLMPARSAMASVRFE